MVCNIRGKNHLLGVISWGYGCGRYLGRIMSYFCNYVLEPTNQEFTQELPTTWTGLKKYSKHRLSCKCSDVSVINKLYSYSNMIRTLKNNMTAFI